MAQSFSPSDYAVLVVDDDTLLLMDAMDLVADAGFKAYGARDADETIRMMERHSEIRILFTDIQMPGSMDGLKLAHAVRNRWPPVTVIVASGHAKVTEAELPLNGFFFSKPYAPQAIIDVLTRIAGQIES